MAKGYAFDAITKQIELLRNERAQLVTQQREWKESFAESLGYKDEAIAEIQSDIARLDARSDENAILILNVQLAQLHRERDELIERNADTRNLTAEIVAIDGRIATLLASLEKLPMEGIVDKDETD